MSARSLVRGPLALALLAGVAAGVPHPLQAGGAQAPARAPRDVSELLAPIRERHGVPALAGAIFEGTAVVALGADGVRQLGREARVTPEERFHLGSCTKAMTATLIARLVEAKELAWDSTVGAAFSDLVPKMDPAWRAVTLEELLTHRAGAPEELDAGGLWRRLRESEASPPEQRRMLVEGVLARPPVAPPGTKFLYSNAGYAIAGAMAERATGKAWEDLMRKQLFEPLGMESAGFGPPGKPGTLDQPVGHDRRGKPVGTGPKADNPAAIGPAGSVHASLADWARFVAAHLDGERGGAKILRAASFEKLHTPPPGSEPAYAMGWGVTQRSWGGRVLTHSGSNTLWFCTVWIAPEKGFAVLVATNQGGDEAQRACDEAALILIHARSAKAGD
ncbi:MAG TPA: serine hydrolase domain-containing protein [Planctomycetota bacterium]|nr:serine hydrolase domain-containing protein [Planctomycetota bacterium]